MIYLLLVSFCKLTHSRAHFPIALVGEHYIVGAEDDYYFYLFIFPTVRDKYFHQYAPELLHVVRGLTFPCDVDAVFKQMYFLLAQSC